MPRILLIDDHPLYRHGFISALEARLPGYTVVGAASAEEGAAELDRHPDTDLVIIDFRLPEGDGLAALVTFGARHPGVPRVLMSGEEGADLGQRAGRRRIGLHPQVDGRGKRRGSAAPGSGG
ncbi:MAG: response regulator transcription factor [Proteobacteria bacterium]|nr:response regulator transcription factor [Pseudomonadota bacterium]